jgi:hypothetical protein
MFLLRQYNANTLQRSFKNRPEALHNFFKKLHAYATMARVNMEMSFSLLCFKNA